MPPARPSPSARPDRQPLRRLLLLVPLVAAVSACKVEADVDLVARADGAGEVRAELVLDEEATAALTDSGRTIVLDDLRDGGWRVEGPTKTATGTRISASKPFDSPAEATSVAEELTGRNGPIRDVVLRQRRSFLRTTSELTATVDLTKGLEGFSDPELQRALGGLPLGIPGSAFERQIGRPLADVFSLTVTAVVPGSDAVSVRPELGESQRLRVAAQRLNVDTIAAATVSVIAAIAALATGVRARRKVAEPET